MIRQCAWCQKPMGEKAPYEDKSVTHAICPTCLVKASNKIQAGYQADAYRSLAK